MARRCWGELYDMTIGTKLCACNIHNKITVEIQARTTSKSGNVDRQGWNLPSYFHSRSEHSKSSHTRPAYTMQKLLFKWG